MENCFRCNILWSETSDGCVAVWWHECLNCEWDANMTELQILCICCLYTKKGSLSPCGYMVVCCVCVCAPTVATKCLMCWGSSPFDKLSPGFSCSPASLCWKQCAGTGPPASPPFPRSPAETHKDTALTSWSFLPQQQSTTQLPFQTLYMLEYPPKTLVLLLILELFVTSCDFHPSSGIIELRMYKLFIILGKNRTKGLKAYT